jgi:hypothetical protein
LIADTRNVSVCIGGVPSILSFLQMTNRKTIEVLEREVIEEDTAGLRSR